jgi:hypothetical protein
MKPEIDPALPCKFLPGSEGKILCLRARWLAGLPLWHPLDAGTSRRASWKGQRLGRLMLRPSALLAGGPGL